MTVGEITAGASASVTNASIWAYSYATAWVSTAGAPTAVSSGMVAAAARLYPKLARRAPQWLKYSETAGKHFNEVVKRGQFMGQLSRPYMRSLITVRNIMNAGKPIKEAGGTLVWEVPGTFRGSQGIWELVVDPKTGTIFHFLFKS